MSLLEEHLDEMVVRVARGRLPMRPMGGRFQRPARRDDVWIGHDACGCGTGCGGGCGCGCVSCGGDEAAVAPRPRAARGQTSASAASSQLPRWRGWTSPVRLSEIIAARDAGPSSAAARQMSQFLARGSRVYRITRDGIDLDRPLNIGMTISNSILERMIQHHRGPGGDPAVTGAIGGLNANQVIVQAAILTRQGMHPREAKLYENWLQVRERPLLYNAATTTFESAHGFDYA